MKDEWLFVHLVAWVAAMVVSLVINEHLVLIAPIIGSFAFMMTEAFTTNSSYMWSFPHWLVWIACAITAAVVSPWALVPAVVGSIIFCIGQGITSRG